MSLRGGAVTCQPHTVRSEGLWTGHARGGSFPRRKRSVRNVLVRTTATSRARSRRISSVDRAVPDSRTCLFQLEEVGWPPATKNRLREKRP